MNPAEGGPGPIAEWTAEHRRRARSEGWDVFSRTDGPRFSVQRIDALERFRSDVDAVAHVSWFATNGSEPHRAALRIEEHYRMEAEALGARGYFPFGLARPRGEDEMLEDTVP